MDPLGLQAAIAKAETALQGTMTTEQAIMKQLIDYAALKFEAAGERLIASAIAQFKVGFGYW